MKFQVKGEFQNLREKRGFQEGLMQIKKNPEIPGFCVSKSRGLRTDHKRVKKIETESVFLFCYADNNMGV